MYLIDQHYAVWTQDLFPLLQQAKVPCYKTVVDILSEAGVNVNEELVRKYFSVIRKRRGIPAKSYWTHRGVTPTVTLTPQAATSTRPKPVPSPVTAAPAPVVQASPPVVSAPAIEPVEVADWRAELRRLEQQDSPTSWCGQDQWMWDYFTGQANKIGATLPKDFILVERFIKDPIQIDCMNLLMTMRRRNQMK